MFTTNRNLATIKINFIKKIIYILSLGIEPIIVFDGATPEAKKRITQLRKERKDQYHQKVEQSKKKGILNQAKIKLLKNVLRDKNDEISDVEVILQSEDEEIYSSESTSEVYDLDIVSCIRNVDFESEDLKSLPLEIQHKVLQYMKNYLKINSNNDFANAQDTFGGNSNSQVIYLLSTISLLKIS